MENRKELSEKSKQLIAMHFKSDILNESTGYYKQEKIYPVTGKPNETTQNIKEFIPQYKELKANEMIYHNLLSDQQKHNSSMLKNLKLINNKRNAELDIMRKRAKTIKDNCYDDNGNFSAKRRYLYEFYGIDKMNNTSIYNRNIEDKKIEEDNKFNPLYTKKTPKSKKILEKYNIITNKIIENNVKNNDPSNINNNEKKYNKINRNKDTQIRNKDVMHYRKRTDITDLSISNMNNDNKNKTFNENNINKTNINNTIPFEEKIITKKRTEPMLYTNNKDETQKELDTNNNINNNNGNNNNNNNIINNKNNNKRVNKYDNDKEYFTIEIKDMESIKNEPLIDKKKVKEIFYKNGLHLYDINDDRMNLLCTEKKMEAKIRKNKDDENFDKNYKKVIKELNKLNVDVDKRKMFEEKRIDNKEERKRKKTPGTALLRNKDLKDENTKINAGIGYGHKRDFNIQPMNDKNYKNEYNFKMKYFNHNK